MLYAEPAACEAEAFVLRDVAFAETFLTAAFSGTSADVFFAALGASLRVAWAFAAGEAVLSAAVLGVFSFVLAVLGAAGSTAVVFGADATAFAAFFLGAGEAAAFDAAANFDAAAFETLALGAVAFMATGFTASVLAAVLEAFFGLKASLTLGRSVALGVFVALGAVVSVFLVLAFTMGRSLYLHEARQLARSG